MADFFQLGSDPFASGLPQPNNPSIFGFQLPSIPNPFDFLPKNPIDSAITGIGNTLSPVTGFIGKLTSGDTWQRVGLVILGLIFITVALVLFGKGTVRTVIERAVQ